jgi:hypothetical protein
VEELKSNIFDLQQMEIIIKRLFNISRKGEGNRRLTEQIKINYCRRVRRSSGSVNRVFPAQYIMALNNN